MSTFIEDYKAKQAAGFELKGKKIEFPIYHVTGVAIEDLNLSQRSSNGLKRAQLMTVDEVLAADLTKVRNLGAKSIKEIKNAILNYSYENMTETQEANFWREVLK